MQIPTKFVRVKATGHECTINAEDFHQDKHLELAAPKRPEPVAAPTPEPTPEPEKFDETPGTIATVNVDVALSLIDAAGSADALDELERDEKASVKQKGGRKSVLQGIKDRRAVLRKG
jgi:hypothetical protein